MDNLVEHILKYEESLAGEELFARSIVHACCVSRAHSFHTLFFCVSDCEEKGVTSDRLVACITTLYLFSKIRAQLMIKHAMTMQPYLTTKCNVSRNTFSRKNEQI